MRLFVHRVKRRRRNVRIDLRRYNIFMPKELLNRTNIRARVEKVRRKTMAKRVGTHARIEPRLANVVVQFPPYAPR